MAEFRRIGVEKCNFAGHVRSSEHFTHFQLILDVEHCEADSSCWRDGVWLNWISVILRIDRGAITKMPNGREE
jgi:hypothetical protein